MNRPPGTPGLSRAARRFPECSDRPASPAYLGREPCPVRPGRFGFNRLGERISPRRRLHDLHRPRARRSRGPSGASCGPATGAPSDPTFDRVQRGDRQLARVRPAVAATASRPASRARSRDRARLRAGSPTCSCSSSTGGKGLGAWLVRDRARAPTSCARSPDPARDRRRPRPVRALRLSAQSTAERLMERRGPRGPAPGRS